MGRFDFPRMFKASFAYLKSYDFIYDAKFDRTMSDCYHDIVSNGDDYVEIFSNLGYTLVIDADRGYVHVVSFVNRKQNYLRSLKAAALAYWLSKVASENTVLVNGETAPGNRFSQAELEDALGDSQLGALAVGNSKVRLSVSDIVRLGLVEVVPGGSDSHREFVLTGVYQYYIEFAKKVAYIVDPKR